MIESLKIGTEYNSFKNYSKVIIKYNCLVITKHIIQQSFFHCNSNEQELKN